MRTFQMQTVTGKAEVSKLIFGTTYLGNMEKEQPVYQQMDYYFDQGGRCIDTARIYSNFEPTDKRPSEEVIGEWLKANGVRKEMILSTKGAHPAYGHMDQPRLGKDDLNVDISRSLEALQTDYIDVYWLHRDDERLSVEPIMQTLHEFVKQGMVKAIGASNWSVERILEANACAEKMGFTPFTASQIQWSLGDTTPKDLNDETLVCVNQSIYQQYLESQIPLWAFESQAKGLFSKLQQMEEEQLPEKLRMRFLNSSNRERNLQKMSRVLELSKKYQVSPAVISLAYITCNPLSAGAIIGCSNLEQLKDSMQAADFVLSADEVAFLNE